MAYAQAPFELQYGADTLGDITEISFDMEVNEDSVDTVQGRSTNIVTSRRVSVELTFADTDVPAIAVVLPQYFVPNGGTLSTGETVTHEDGAIDVTPGECGVVDDATDVVITSCNGHVLRIPQATTELTSVDFDATRTVTVRFTGLSTASAAQMFASGAVDLAS